MAIITKSRLQALTETRYGSRVFSEILNEAKLEKKAYGMVSVFLSHSHNELEKQSVKGAIFLLKKMGLNIYIDSDDSSLPPFTNAETARKIKVQIENNNKFILLATPKSIQSRWCNWELGYGDAKKYLDKIALFPLSENYDDWSGNEYLNVYPSIEDNDFLSESYRVVYPSGTIYSIADWIKI